MAALSGVKVVELTTMITGPLAGMLLGDLGAEVIKIEHPDGDPFRSFRGGRYSPHFCAYNRNKQSVVLDLRSDLGRQALSKLVAESDVLVANYRPGVLDRLGFADDRLAGVNSRLIRCYISGFGESGPYATRPAYDAVAQALSGMSSLFLDPAEPRIAGPTIADNVTGQYACYGILAALFERERLGHGRRVDVNMLEATIAFMPDPFGYLTQMDLMSDPSLRPRTSQSYAFVCADAKILTVHLSSQPKFWDQFCAALERPDLHAHPELQTRLSRIDHYELIREMAATTFLTQPCACWIDRLTEFTVPCAPVHNVGEVLTDPQVAHLDTFAALRHPQMGELTAIRRPVWFDGNRVDQPLNAPPSLGEHTESVLHRLGLSVAGGDGGSA
jgi:crotonobetainyl-CoA:carnitine CoA-transferase CaiB-like acyl-CoA transferase